MKNKIILIVLLLLIVLLFICVFIGIKIGNLEVLSISQLRTNEEELDKTISSASKLTSVDYPKAIENLESTYERYNIKKQNYEEISGFTDEEDIKYETKLYDIGYLWKTVGSYAKKYNITISMEVKATSVQNIYDLNFTTSGQYVNVSEFIASIENNSDLFFRIYNFKMTGSDSGVSTSFTVKDVNIDPSTISTKPTLDTNQNTAAK